MSFQKVQTVSFLPPTDSYLPHIDIEVACSRRSESKGASQIVPLVFFFFVNFFSRALLSERLEQANIEVTKYIFLDISIILL